MYRIGLSRDGFISLIGILIALMIVFILLSISMTAMLSRQKLDTLNEETILNTTKEKIEEINKKQELRIKQIEQMQ